MAGLRKQKQYDWKDSNMALFGSDTERQVKKESAQQEKAWKKAGLSPGIQIWRIVKFKVTEWPQKDYGQFFEGDSYIILNTYKEEDSENLNYDVHFWIGKYSTQDEYGTAAYKTVELDTYLDDVPIQHREVQDNESGLFKSYFKEITYLKGGAESGFRHVEPEKYIPRLFHFHGDRKGVKVQEIQRSPKLLDDTDVYILDTGLKIFQWNGNGSNKDERMAAMQYVNDIVNQRSGKKVEKEVIDQNTAGGDQEEFMRFLDEEKVEDESSHVQVQVTSVTKKLFRLSDASGSLKFTHEKSDRITMGDFDGKDVFILDVTSDLFVWVGKETTKLEKDNAMVFAHMYLQKFSNPLMPVTSLKEGQKNKEFTSALAA